MEFALIAPVLLWLFLGLVAAGWLLFAYEAVADGARAGAREAIVETELLGAGGCESGSPQPVEAAVQQGAPLLPVDPQPLCQAAGDPEELVQIPVAGDATVTVTGVPDLNQAAVTAVTVTVTLPVTPLPPLPGLTFNLVAHSTLAVS